MMNNETTTIDVPYGLVALDSTARMLAQNAGPLPPSYIAGKTALRDTVMDNLDCSALRAERIVDRLESHGFVRFERPAPHAGSKRSILKTRPRWRISTCIGS